MDDLQITFCLFSWPNCYFCHCMFKFFQSLTLELCICDSGEAYETIAFLQTRGRQMTWKEVSFLGRPYRVLPGYNRRTYIIFWLEVYIVVQLLSCVWLFATPWTAPHQASLSFTISRSLLKLMFTESVMPSNHLILCCPSLRVFSNESVLCIRWPEDWSFSFSISPPNEYSGLISFRIDWLSLCVCICGLPRWH